MWKVFAIICIPFMDPTGLSEDQCQMYYETNNNRYVTEIECDEAARAKAEEMVYGFAEMNVPFTRMQFGCELEKD